MKNNLSRRKFIDFMGRSSLAYGAMGALGACSTTEKTGSKVSSDVLLKAIKPTFKDSLVLAEGLKYDIFAKWGEPIAPGLKFGFNNDFIGCIPISSSEAFLFVNHEYPDPMVIHKIEKGGLKTKEQIVEEQKNVGASMFVIKNQDGAWKFSPEDKRNTRLDALTKIPFAGRASVGGSQMAIGTLGNCSGGITPWKTFLTCEEVYPPYYGEIDPATGALVPDQEGGYGWQKFFKGNPEHYGWVVEFDPRTQTAKKHTSLGRFFHEGATCTKSKDGRTVVYMGDDSNDQFLYKFISDQHDSLETGILYVANVEQGTWIPLLRDQHEVLKKNFKTQMEIQIRTRMAAKLVGATPLDRPEDIEIDPKTNSIIVALTNNKPKKNFYGSLLKIEEKNQDFASLKFTSSTFVAGGPSQGISCPDNLVFDPKGNLWVTNDISGYEIGKGAYTDFGNNGLYYIPMSGKNAGKAYQLASAPSGAEFTGPCFSPDGQTLFLSVQHPGEYSSSPRQWNSQWPDGKGSEPKPAVVAISGPLLNQLMG